MNCQNAHVIKGQYKNRWVAYLVAKMILSKADY